MGKNKIVDRFLHLLNLPREYLQLHRWVCNDVHGLGREDHVRIVLIRTLLYVWLHRWVGIDVHGLGRDDHVRIVLECCLFKELHEN